jgi:hypothetical protein
MSLAARYRAACAALELPVWRPGMRTSSKFERVVTVDTDTGDPACAEAGATEDDCACVWMPCDAVEPDFTDPATIGVLLAAVREAWASPTLFVRPTASGWTVMRGSGAGMGKLSDGATEAGALIAALEAAAARPVEGA